MSARKIKDNAADWHNLMMKWETLNDNGFSIANKIVNIKNATQFEDSNLEIEHEDPSDSERLPLNYNMELEQCCTELLETLKKMAKIHEKMEKLCSTTKGVCDLETYHHAAEPKAPLFHTWPISHFRKDRKKISPCQFVSISGSQTFLVHCPFGATNSSSVPPTQWWDSNFCGCGLI
uniref:Cyclin-dependent kinase 2-interacting protein n=1 Tax=Laticauda laticaudata TaxID=8630 RepID=A0A8C5WQT0_LATLA